MSPFELIFVMLPRLLMYREAVEPYYRNGTEASIE